MIPRSASQQSERPGHTARRILQKPQPLGDVVPRRDEHAADHVAVPVQVFRRRMQHDVRGALQRTLEERSRERVIDDVQKAVRLGQIADRGKIGQVHHGIGRGLAEDHAGRRCHGPLDLPDIAHIDEREPEAKPGIDLLHQTVGAAIDVLAADDVIAGFEQLERRIEGGEAGAEREAVGGAFQARDIPLQGFAGRVLGPGVFVALMAPEPLLHVRRRLINRGHDRAGEQVPAPGRRGSRAW